MKGKKSGKWSLLLTIALGAVFVFCAGKAGVYFYHSLNNRQVNTKLKEIFYHPRVTAVDESRLSPDVPQEEALGLEALREINGDVFGWLSIEGAEIDYPVLQGESNNEYLRSDIYHEYQQAGCIFADYRCDVLRGKNLVIYGHNMDDGSMFGKLKRYLKQDFYDENPCFYLYTEEGTYCCQVFSVYQTTTEDFYAQMEFASDEEFQSYLDKYKSQSAIKTSVTPKASDRVVTLSTCDYLLDKTQGRLAVQAVMTLEPEKPADTE